MKHEDPMIVAIALSLYAYNVSAQERAEKLYNHFDGACMELGELTALLAGGHAQYLATELPFETATVYVQHALDEYGAEAEQRVVAEREYMYGAGVGGNQLLPRATSAQSRKPNEAPSK